MSRDVFLVHGHDEGAKDSVARFLESIKSSPIILHEQASRGQTIIEKIVAHGDVAFAIVVLTPDDEGGPIGGPKSARARQNVILELGYFIARLGRDRVCALRVGDLETPSDFDGVIYVPMDRHKAWQTELARELNAAGLEVDLNTLLGGRPAIVDAKNDRSTNSLASESEASSSDWILAKISVRQAEEVIRSCAQRTRDLIDLLSTAKPEGLTMSEMADHFKVDPIKLTGMWTGLTRVTRRVTGRSGAVLINWEQVGSASEWTGSLHPVTRQSFRQIRNIG